MIVRLIARVTNPIQSMEYKYYDIQTYLNLYIVGDLKYGCYMTQKRGGTNLYAPQANLFRLDEYILVNNAINTGEHVMNIEDTSIKHQIRCEYNNNN